MKLSKEHFRLIAGIGYNFFMLGAFLPLITGIPLFITMIRYPQLQLIPITFPAIVIVGALIGATMQTAVDIYFAMLCWQEYKGSK